MRSISPSSVLSLVCAALVASCSSGSTTTTSQTIAKLAGDGQSATVGTTVATRPSVKITDQNGAAVSGVSVTFSVVSGGGSVTGASATTGSDGVATVGSWTLGATAGANTLYASASGVTGSPVTFAATGTAVAVPVATAMTKQAGDAQTAAVSTAVTVAPAVKLVDASGNPVAGIAVTFAVASGGGSVAGGSATTNASGIATVGSWTLGATAGADTLTATATGSGITGNPATFTATATAAAFSPTANTTLSGTQTFGSVNIPAGVTVTMTANTTINVSGTVTIAGTLAGDCVNLTLTATGVLNSNGNINNGCSGALPPSGPPSMTLIATGGYHLTAGTITLGGSLNLTNDATLTDATFAAPPAPVGLRGTFFKQVGVCSVANVPFFADPATAAAGAAKDPTGDPGKPASNGWTLQCTGELDFNGNVIVSGPNGGAGGAGTNSTPVNAVAHGGNGGTGGNITVRALGDVVMSGGNNVLTSGNGGAGGSATATGNPVGNPGGSGTATGGDGGAPGNLIVQAKGGGITIPSGGLTLVVGTGGNGGAATATGANGFTSPACPAGNGGAATATGGAGASTPNKTLTGTGDVSSIGNVIVAGGTPGLGGNATATAGNGGVGSFNCIPGGNGGVPRALGGKGGDAQLRDGAGALFANGAKGGFMTDLNGNGGDGYNDCVVGALQAGGNGGTGASAFGADGNGGTGKANGAAGGGAVTNVGNGGNGGNGMGPGTGGAAGSNTTIVANGGATVTGSFVAGTNGTWCAVAKTATFTIPNPATDDPSSHDAVLQLVALGAHSTSIATTGLSNNLIPGIVFTCTFNTNTQIITCVATNFTYMARTITLATFTGTWNVLTQQLVGDMVITIQGQANTVKYHIIDP